MCIFIRTRTVRTCIATCKGVRACAPCSCVCVLYGMSLIYIYVYVNTSECVRVRVHLLCMFVGVWVVRVCVRVLVMRMTAGTASEFLLLFDTLYYIIIRVHGGRGTDIFSDVTSFPLRYRKRHTFGSLLLTVHLFLFLAQCSAQNPRSTSWKKIHTRIVYNKYAHDNRYVYQ